MTKISTVLVPGAAGPAGINTIKSLQIAKFQGKMVATDSNPLAAGFFLASTYSVMPKAADEDSFMEKLFQVVTENGVQLLMPSSGYDVPLYSKYHKELEKLGARPIVSKRENLEICRDKLLTYERLRGKFNVPFTTTNQDKVKGFPVIAKPRFEKGRGDAIKVENESDLRYVASKYHDNMIFQDFLPGIEYTVDVLSNLECEPLIAVPRIRLETKAGVSTTGKIIRDPKLEMQCMEIAKSVGIMGPCCIQLKESEKGVPRLVEINARMGGGTIFTTLAGANFPKMILDMVEGKEIVIPKISEVTIIRYFEEIVVSEKKKASIAEAS